MAEAKTAPARKEKTAAELKAKAAELLKQAEELEQRAILKAGKVAKKFYEGGCKNLEVFKADLAGLFE